MESSHPYITSGGQNRGSAASDAGRAVGERSSSERGWLTLAQLAARWSMCPKTLRNWRADGKGPVGIRQGREVVFSLETVVEWEAQQKRESAAELEAKLLSDDYTITVRQHPKYPDRLQADLLLPSPYKRTRLAVPKGMTGDKDIALWARREGRRIMREQKLDLGEKKEEKPASNSASTTTANSSMSLASFWNGRFVPEKVRGQRPGTQADTNNAWRLHISLELGDVPLDKIDAARIYEFQAQLQGKPELKKASTRNKIIQKLKACLRYAVKRKVLPFDHDFETEDEEAKKIPKMVYSSAEIERMTPAASAIGTEHEVYILLLTNACVRIGELNALHWSDLNMNLRTIKVQRTEWMHRIQDNPKGQVGTVPMTSALHSALIRWREEGGDRGPLVLPMYDAGQKVWRCRHGAGLLKAILRRAGLRLEGPHMLRHSVLTHLAESGVSPYALQALARHTHLSTTMRYYVHLEQAKMANQAVSMLERPARSVTPMDLGGNPAGSPPTATI